MKVNKFIFGLIFILSLSFNAAFLIHLITTHTSIDEKPVIQVQLSLTKQQKKRMEPIRLKIHKDNEAIKKQIHQCHQKLLTALKNEPIDKPSIYQFIDNISLLQKKIQQNTVEEIIQIKKFMTPDQCNCLVEGLGISLHQTTKQCDCPNCILQQKD